MGMEWYLKLARAHKVGGDTCGNGSAISSFRELTELEVIPLRMEYSLELAEHTRAEVIMVKLESYKVFMKFEFYLELSQNVCYYIVFFNPGIAGYFC